MAIHSSFRPHKRVSLDTGDVSRTRQEFAEECDINSIMSRYNKTGVINHFSSRAPRYVDFSEVPSDLQTAMQMFIEAENAFMRLPAAVRKEFDNDPVKFVEFAERPENLDQVRAWGLAKPAEPEPVPMRVEVVNPPPEVPEGGKPPSK